ncbi:hypothetical protein [Pusillimonas sp. ANT_WB101]|uniref:hypothetical protein n=1 Tax=Pusillimonas sp. ANT_WB101 TaxID=2597356 RepID=UPI0011EE0F48|nr:hypothetical protein [Pusillimonas sp. ANT_WB101]KAA0889603.1 hypothetical protein FQ179_20960 [Pusillimonas sp. ANT_WB101]
MSWRFILAILLIAAGASAWGGLHLGNWLVAHGPSSPVESTDLQLANTPVLDANGQPFMAMPPQPLVNGRLGVPELPDQVAWQIPEASVRQLEASSAIQLSTTTITMDVARQIAQGDFDVPGLSGIADVGNLVGGGSGRQPLQPVDMAPPPPAPSTATPQNDQAWQASLRRELQACSAKSFFDRPSCAWAARNKYCEPNNAWGRVGNCPAKTF